MSTEIFGTENEKPIRFGTKKKTLKKGSSMQIDEPLSATLIKKEQPKNIKKKRLSIIRSFLSPEDLERYRRAEKFEDSYKDIY